MSKELNAELHGLEAQLKSAFAENAPDAYIDELELAIGVCRRNILRAEAEAERQAAVEAKNENMKRAALIEDIAVANAEFCKKIAAVNAAVDQFAAAVIDLGKPGNENALIVVRNIALQNKIGLAGMNRLPEIQMDALFDSTRTAGYIMQTVIDEMTRQSNFKQR